jgi:hypothetical protein
MSTKLQSTSWPSPFKSPHPIARPFPPPPSHNHFPPLFIPVHCKKELAIFPSPAGMSLTKLSLGGKKLNFSRPGRVWSVTSRLGTGKRPTLSYSVYIFLHFFRKYLMPYAEDMAVWKCLHVYFCEITPQTIVNFLVYILLFLRVYIKKFSLLFCAFSYTLSNGSFYFDLCKWSLDNFAIICFSFTLFLLFNWSLLTLWPGMYVHCLSKFIKARCFNIRNSWKSRDLSILRCFCNELARFL